MSKGGKPQVQNQTYTPNQGVTDYQTWLRGLGQGEGGNLSSLLGGNSFLSGLMNTGSTGANALAGDPASAQQFMSPYTSAMNPVFDRMRQQAGLSADQNATMQGAYGGDRAALQRGAEMGQVDASQAGYMNDAFNQGMGRAGMSANLGMGASQQKLMGLLQMLNMGLMGPQGYSSQTMVPTQKNLLGDAAGGAMIGSKFGPWGAGIGGGIGLLGGLFS